MPTSYLTSHWTKQCCYVSLHRRGGRIYQNDKIAVLSLAGRYGGSSKAISYGDKSNKSSFFLAKRTLIYELFISLFQSIHKSTCAAVSYVGVCCYSANRITLTVFRSEHEMTLLTRNTLICHLSCILSAFWLSTV